MCVWVRLFELNAFNVEILIGLMKTVILYLYMYYTVIQYQHIFETSLIASIPCRFKVLKEFYTYQPNQSPLTDYQAVGVVLGKVGVSGWANGLHKVFLKFNHPLELDRHSQHVLLHIISIQRCKHSPVLY